VSGGFAVVGRREGPRGRGAARTLALTRFLMSARASSMRSCRVCCPASASSSSESAGRVFRWFRGAIEQVIQARARVAPKTGTRERHRAEILGNVARAT